MEKALARNTDPSTSHEAAKTVNAGDTEALVYAAILDSKEAGLIAAELPTKTGLPLNTATPRTAQLQKKGLIVATNERRKGPSGRKQIVWKASEFYYETLVTQYGTGTNAALGAGQSTVPTV